MQVNESDALEAVRTLLFWAGEDPDREGLLDTPRRVVKAYKEWFAGYDKNPAEILARTFEDSGGYDEVVVLKDIPFESHCEHHMVPIIGKVHIGYLPNSRVVGISKLARVVGAYSKRLQIQEKMTNEIAISIQEFLQPKGVAVIVEGTHLCMTTRGVNKPGASMTTSSLKGVFRDNQAARLEVLKLLMG